MVPTQKGQKETVWTVSQNIYFICLCQAMPLLNGTSNKSYFSY